MTWLETPSVPHPHPRPAPQPHRIRTCSVTRSRGIRVHANVGDAVGGEVRADWRQIPCFKKYTKVPCLLSIRNLIKIAIAFTGTTTKVLKQNIKPSSYKPTSNHHRAYQISFPCQQSYFPVILVIAHKRMEICTNLVSRLQGLVVRNTALE